MRYQPKRSTQRWLEGAPDYILACYDNGGKTCDRYTVLFGGAFWDEIMGRKVQILTVSEYPASLWGEWPAWDRASLGKKIRWADLPHHVQQHIIRRAED